LVDEAIDVRKDVDVVEVKEEGKGCCQDCHPKERNTDFFED
jgi:hypothetical protein